MPVDVRVYNQPIMRGNDSAYGEGSGGGGWLARPWRGALWVLLFWSTSLALSLFWNLHNAERQMLDLAYTEGRAAREKDMAFRRWGMRHAGVYVPVTASEPPSPFLAHLPDRDVTTADGRLLTLRAPAIMVREMMDDYLERTGVRGRIVAMKYLNPVNAPDAWEKAQLESFEYGEKTEVWEVAEMNGKPHLRHLRAWFMEPVCVKCHAVFGYRVGDLRGATGVNLPLEPYYERLVEVRTNLFKTHGVIWLAGIAGIGWAGRQARERLAERRSAEEMLRMHASIFEHSGEAILVTDGDHRIVSVNPAFELQTGYSLDDLRGLSPEVLSAGRTPPEIYREIRQSLERTGQWQGELVDKRKDGGEYPKWTSISTIRNAAGAVTHYVASFIDISERKAAEERIRYLAHHDSLTGLANRYSMEIRLGQVLATSRREETPLAVLFIDMDRFKNINDSLGHHVGDKLLVEVARRLHTGVRESDIVARLGGDEFVVVLAGMDAARDAVAVGGKILDMLAQPYLVDSHILHSTPSIGVSIYPDDGADADSLLKNADAAMYHAKERGRNNLQFFTAALAATAAERLDLERDLRVALAAEALEVHFQPQVDARDGRVCGFEALARWRHAEHGWVSPVKFIPVAEESGLIEQLGEWMLDRACRQLAEWRNAGIAGVRMAVNISAHQLRSATLVDRVRASLDRHGLVPGDLELEITESTAMADPEQAIARLHALRTLGVTLAIDDFGTGYSSLAYLKRLPIQVLKIDRAFVSDIETDTNDAAICSATIALAKSLGLKVVAEGMETVAQRDFLILHGCDYLQGYFFGKPEPAETWLEQLKTQLTH